MISANNLKEPGSRSLGWASEESTALSDTWGPSAKNSDCVQTSDPQRPYSVNVSLKMLLKVAQSRPTLCEPVDYSPPGSSIHGISQARTLEWSAISFSRGSSWTRNRTRVSCITGRLGKGDDWGWDGWMASPTQCTWVSVNSGSWWWTGRPGVLRFMGLQSRTRLSDWTDWLNVILGSFKSVNPSAAYSIRLLQRHFLGIPNHYSSLK